MSLRDFQRALADLVASPDFCQETLQRPENLALAYELTELELRRLLYCVQHRGMKVCWSLHRANRMGPIHGLLPLTCAALGRHLRTELECFWREALPSDLQFQSEGERFAEFLLRRLGRGQLDLSVLEDVVPLELAIAELGFQPRRLIGEIITRALSQAETVLMLHPSVRLMAFRHDPEILLGALTQNRSVPSNLRRGEFFVLVDGKQEGTEIRSLDYRLGFLLSQIKLGLLDLREADQAILLDAGLICLWPKGIAASFPRRALASVESGTRTHA